MQYDVPPEFTLLKIEGPDLDVPSISLDELPEGWSTRLEVSRDLGNPLVGYKCGRSAAGSERHCPPKRRIFCSNPSHQNAAQFEVVEVIAYPFDPRLKK